MKTKTTRKNFMKRFNQGDVGAFYEFFMRDDLNPDDIASLQKAVKHLVMKIATAKDKAAKKKYERQFRLLLTRPEIRKGRKPGKKSAESRSIEQYIIDRMCSDDQEHREWREKLRTKTAMFVQIEKELGDRMEHPAVDMAGYEPGTNAKATYYRYKRGLKK